MQTPRQCSKELWDSWGRQQLRDMPEDYDSHRTCELAVLGVANSTTAGRGRGGGSARGGQLINSFHYLFTEHSTWHSSQNDEQRMAKRQKITPGWRHSTPSAGSPSAEPRAHCIRTPAITHHPRPAGHIVPRVVGPKKNSHTPDVTDSLFFTLATTAVSVVAHA